MVLLAILLYMQRRIVFTYILRELGCVKDNGKWVCPDLPEVFYHGDRHRLEEYRRPRHPIGGGEYRPHHPVDDRSGSLPPGKSEREWECIENMRNPVGDCPQDAIIQSRTPHPDAVRTWHG